MILIASYPKSGNTWMRALLTCCFRPGDPFNINTLLGSPILSVRSEFDETMGLTAADMQPAHVEQVFPDYCRLIAQQLDPPGFVKTHLSYRRGGGSPPVFPADAVQAVIYVLRNPMDVALSYRRHQGRDLATVIARMTDAGNTLYSRNEHSYLQLHQHLGRWDTHVLDWTTQTSLPVCVIRYEDLCLDPEQTLGRVLDHIGADIPDEIRRTAVSTCRFDQLQQQERQDGFVEGSYFAERFFDRGPDRDWRRELPDWAIASLQSEFKEVMTRFGYPGRDDPGSDQPRPPGTA